MKRPDTTGGAALAAGLSQAQWAEFLGRHDPVWELPPDCWEHGAFIGDGLQGAMIHLDGEGEARRLIWELGFPGDGVVEVNLKKGQSVLFFSGNEKPELKVEPLPVPAGSRHAFGLKRGYQRPFFMRPV